MSYVIDTNILARSIQESHPMHLAATEAVEALVSRGEVVCVFPQTLYELRRPRDGNSFG
jgi:predicted nucleic acid-binding protein